MAKLTLTDLANLSNESTAVAAINANNTAIEAAIENTISRDGTAPNTMSDNIDANTNRIINLPAPTDDTEPLRKGDVALSGATVNITESNTMDDGNAASPGMPFTDDTDTGLYRTGADAMGIATGGVAALSIDSSQNILIPAGNLTLTNTNLALGSGTVITTGLIDVGAITATSLLIDSGNIDMGAFGRKLILDTDSDSYIHCSADDNLEMFTGGVEALQIDSAQKVTIPGACEVTGTFTVGGSSIASPGLVLLETQTASAVANLEFSTGFSGTYLYYVLMLAGLQPASDGVRLMIRVSSDGGTSFISTAGAYAWTTTGGTSSADSNTDTSDTEILVTHDTIGTGTAEHVGGKIEFVNMNEADYMQCIATTGYIAASGAHHQSVTSGMHKAQTALNGIQLLFDTGNITSGHASLYGMLAT